METRQARYRDSRARFSGACLRAARLSVSDHARTYFQKTCGFAQLSFGSISAQWFITSMLMQEDRSRVIWARYPKGEIVSATVADRRGGAKARRSSDRRLQLIGWEPRISTDAPAAEWREANTGRL